MNTPITAESFASAKKGDLILDCNKNHWTFMDEPTKVKSPPSLVKRFLLPPGYEESEAESFTYSTIYGENNIIDEEMGILIEFDAEGVLIISPEDLVVQEY
jgi:hypothetical protein